MINLTDYFDRVLVMNLDCCPERWAAFEETAKKAGVTGYQRFRAIHGDTCQHPSWWRAGNGAWGCLKSHVRILEDALMDGLENYLVFEDDVVFSSDFADRLPKVMKKLEDSPWDQLYLGGQHLYKEAGWSCPYREGIVRAININRTHAFAVNKPFMLKLYQHIQHAPDYIDSHKTWTSTDSITGEVKTHESFFHVDHQMGSIHERRMHFILASDPWLCGQGANTSNINGQVQDEQWWHDKGWPA